MQGRLIVDGGDGGLKGQQLGGWVAGRKKKKHGFNHGARYLDKGSTSPQGKEKVEEGPVGNRSFLLSGVISVLGCWSRGTVVKLGGVGLCGDVLDVESSLFRVSQMDRGGIQEAKSKAKGV